MTLTTVIENSIAAFDSADWNRCFPTDPENWAFYRACEEAGPSGFAWHYLAVRENGRPIAVVPAFGTEYRLDTTVQGTWKGITNQLYRLAPGLLSLRLIALGSPVAEICHLGFAPEAPADDRLALLARIIVALREFGAVNRYGLLGIKDAPSRDDGLWRSALLPSGFTRLPGLPTAVLDLPFSDFEAYLDSLSKATRRDMRRKLRTFKDIRIEQRRQIDDVEAQVSALYGQTVAHSDLQFEYLPVDYFPQLLRSLAPAASIFLYWHGGELVAFNFVIETADRLIDKYLGISISTVGCTTCATASSAAYRSIKAARLSTGRSCGSAAGCNPTGNIFAIATRRSTRYCDSSPNSCGWTASILRSPISSGMRHDQRDVPDAPEIS
jgi:hypothetical protein